MPEIKLADVLKWLMKLWGPLQKEKVFYYDQNLYYVKVE